MEFKKQKTKCYYNYLSGKQDQFTKSLIRIGGKLVCLDEAFDLNCFLKAFVPSKCFLKKKILEEAQQSQKFRIPDKSDPGNNCNDSHLIDALKAEFTKFEKDFQKLLAVTDPDEDESCVASNDSLKNSLEPSKDKPKNFNKDDINFDSETHHINQVLNPGEMSKIFVQKTNFDVAKFKTDKPDFEGENLDTIYIYRSKN